MTTRKTRLLKVFASFFPDDGRGSVKWFIERAKAHGLGHTKSVVYRWFDGENIVDADPLEGLLQVLEADAILCRLDRAQAEIDDIKGGLK